MSKDAAQIGGEDDGEHDELGAEGGPEALELRDARD